jgi:hypothetical protein
MESQIGSRRKEKHMYNGKTKYVESIEGLETLRKHYEISNRF